MLRQQRLAPTAKVARAVLSLIASTAAVLALVVAVAGPAYATPETDAADAINGAFAAGGGPGGPLGAEVGDVYPVGSGFARNYANGRIYFTPETGARTMTGAILAKYDELGGPADGDLGFPTDNELTGAFSPDSRYTTFADGIIYYTAGTGAWLVRGPINAAWDKLGSTASPLGAPVDDARWNGPVLTQRFTGGELSWNIATGAFTSVPPELAGGLGDLPPQKVEPNVAINAVWRASGGPTVALGAKQGDIYPAGRDGIAQDFAGGTVFFSAATGPALVSGAILERYLGLGGPGGELGFPTASEADGGIPNSRISSFGAEDKPVIFWTPEHGAIVVRGAINAAWGTLGGAPAQIGVPIAEQTVDGDVATQAFSGGQISYDSATQQYTTQPPELAEQLGGIQVPTTTVAPPPTTDSALPAADGAGAGFSWTWWWFLVPLLVLLLAVAGALLWRRERKKPTDHGQDGPAPGPYGEGTDEDREDHREYLPSQPAPSTVDAQPPADRAQPPAAQWQPGPPDPREHWGPASEPQPAGAAATATDHEGDDKKTPDEDQGRHEAGSELSGWGEGQDDIDTDSFPPVDEKAAPPQSRHAAAAPAAEDAPRDDEDPTTAIPAPPDPTGAGPGRGAPPRRSYPYESVPMFEPWQPQDPARHDGPPSPREPGREQPDRWAGERHSRVSYDRGDEPYRGSPYDNPRPAERPAEGGRRQESVLQGAHLPLADRNRAPRGYPIKGDATTGHYYTPDNPEYASATAEIWFDTEESARASGFFKER